MVLYMEKGSKSYQLGLCMEQDPAIVLHEQKFPLCTEILILLNLGVLLPCSAFEAWSV